MRILITLIAFLAISSSVNSTGEFSKREAKTTKNENEKRVVCYYTNWSVYRKGLAKFTPQNINPYMCTHLIYAFGGLTDEFEVTTFDSYQDIELSGYAQFNGLKQYNKGMKTLLALGGWNEGSARFSELVSLKEYRENFTHSVLKHLRRYNFDGLDLDWEYPGSRDGSTPEDKANYALLVKELREAFEKESSKSSKERLLLTMAVPAGQNYIDKGYDVPTLNRYLDFFNLLSYDYHSVYEPTANHHAALLPPPGTSEYEVNYPLNVDWTIRYYLKKGASKNKIVVGIPTYGRSYTLLDGTFYTLSSSANGPGVKGNYTNEKGYLAFYEVCEVISVDGWEVRKPYPKRLGPFAFKGDQWVGYDDENIVIKKTEYVRDNGLGGVMFWTLDSDDFRGLCNGRQYPLIEAAKETLFKTLPTDENEARALSPSSRNKLLKSSGTATTATESSKRRRPGNRRDRPNLRSPVTIDPLNTPEPPPTPSSVKGYNCKREGFFPDPDNCKKYFYCLKSGTAGLGIVAHSFTCPSDLLFNKNINNCDHPNSVKCKVTPNRGGDAGPLSATTPIPRTTEFEYLLDDYDYYYYDFPSEAQPVVKPLGEPTQVETPPESTSIIEPQTRNSGANQFHEPKEPLNEIVSVSEEPFTSPASRDRQRTRPTYASVRRDQSRKPVTINAEEPAIVEDRRTPSRSKRPQYVTLERQRPSGISASDVAEETGGDVIPIEVATESNRGLTYVTLNRQRKPITESSLVAEEKISSPRNAIKYVTLSRDTSVPVTEEPLGDYYEYYYYDELNDALDANTSLPQEPSTTVSTTTTTETTTTTTSTTTTTTPTTTTTTTTTTTPKPKLRIPPRVRTSRPKPTPGSTFRRRPSRFRGRTAPEIAVTPVEPELINEVQEETTTPTVKSDDVTEQNKETIDSTIPDTEDIVSKSVDLFQDSKPKEEKSTAKSTDGESLIDETLLLFQQNVEEKQIESPVEEISPKLADVLSRTESSLSVGKIEETTPSVEEPESTVIPVESSKQDSRPFIVKLPSRTRIPPRTQPTRDRDRALPSRRPSVLSRPALKATEPSTESAQKEKESTPKSSSPPFSFNDLLSTKSIVSSTAKSPSREFRLRFTTSTEKSPHQTQTTPLSKIESPETTDKISSSSPNIDFLLNLFEATTAEPKTSKTPAATETNQTLEETKFRFTPRPVVRLSSTPEIKTTFISTTERAIPRRPSPQIPKTTKSPSLSPNEYEYVYDDYDLGNGALGGSLGDLASLSNKAVIRADGSIECSDTGYFPHPESCKKFISCSKTVRGHLRGWVYTCPQELVFDPVGGMCNWTETVDCLAK